MDKLNFGDVVLLKFPYTDGKTFKRRPALIINDYNDGDIIVCRITSQIFNSKQDMVEIILGKINESVKTKVNNIIANLTD